MEINWVLMTYFVVGVYAISGFYRGWWKEGITTGGLAILIFLLKNSSFAGDVIGYINTVLAYLWSFAPITFQDFFESALSIEISSGQPYQLDAASAGTWVLILFILVTITTILGRVGSGPTLTVTPAGGALGALVGGLNGFLLINILREYLDGRALPGSAITQTSAILLEGSDGTIGVASSSVAIQAVNLPHFTILDSWMPWMFIIIGVLVILSVLKEGYQVEPKLTKLVTPRTPYGYKS